jgi:crossover junction endodeoxyribonuclease RusA
VRIVLPYPVSGNRYWRHVRTPHRTLVYRSSEADAYRDEVRARCRAGGLPAPHIGPVTVGVILHPRLRKRGGASNTVIDLDNGLKVLFDALQGCAFIRDSQVRKLAAEYGEAMDGGGVTVTVQPMEDVS